MLPQVCGILAFGLVPFALVIWYSFHTWRPLAGTFDFVGTANYAALLQDEQVARSLVVTLLFALGLVACNVVLAMVLALLMNRRFRGVSVFRAVFFSPVVVPIVAWTIIWNYLLASNGGVNQVLGLIGINGPNWFRTPWVALAAVVAVQVTKGIGINMVLFLAALQGVPTELKEAARLDGASARRVLTNVTLPLLTPTLLMVVMITVVGSLEVFAPVQILTGGGPSGTTTVLSYYLYEVAFSRQQFGYASVIGVLLFLVTFVLTGMQWLFRKRWVHDEI